MVTAEEARGLRKIGRRQRAGRWFSGIGGLAFALMYFPWFDQNSTNRIRLFEALAVLILILGISVITVSGIYLWLGGARCPRCRKPFFAESHTNPSRIKSRSSSFVPRELVSQFCRNCGLAIAEADYIVEPNTR
jgi:hypothetical protein